MLYRKHERIVNILIGAGIMSIFLIGTIAYYQGFYVKEIESKSKQNTLQEFKDRNKGDLEYKVAVVAMEPILPGEEIDNKKVALIEVPIKFIPDDAIGSKDKLNKKLSRLNISRGTIISSSMLLDYDSVVTADLRIQDYFNIRKFYSLKKGDVVDIRIKRSDGRDDIVSSKKEITDIVNEMVCFNVNEFERQNLNYASVEALVSKAEIYTTLYVDPYNQPPAKVTFVPDPKVLSMVANNPDMISEAKRELSERIKQENKAEQERKALSQGMTNQSTVNKSSNIQNNSREEKNSAGYSAEDDKGWTKVE